MPREWKAGVRPNSTRIWLPPTRLFSAGYGDSTDMTTGARLSPGFTKSDEAFPSLYSFGDFCTQICLPGPGELRVNPKVPLDRLWNCSCTRFTVYLGCIRTRAIASNARPAIAKTGRVRILQKGFVIFERKGAAGTLFEAKKLLEPGGAAVP